jgi:hypothetical protein
MVVALLPCPGLQKKIQRSVSQWRREATHIFPPCSCRGGHERSAPVECWWVGKARTHESAEDWTGCAHPVFRLKRLAERNVLPQLLHLRCAACCEQEMRSVVKEEKYRSRVGFDSDHHTARAKFGANLLLSVYMDSHETDIAQWSCGQRNSGRALVVATNQLSAG